MQIENKKIPPANTSAETPAKSRAVVLLSGGLDSSTTLAIAHQLGFELYALTIFYGQRNTFELSSAKALIKFYPVIEHKILELDLKAFGGSSLTGSLPVEKKRTKEQISQGIPLTYVPVRNTLFLSYALAWAEVLEAPNIFIGVNAVDFSGYPDCRPEFIQAFSNLANLGTRMGTEGKQQIKIHTPLISLTKAQIIEQGLLLAVPYELSSTCYDPDLEGLACGTCDSCILRQRGFYELGKQDPLSYRERLAPNAP